MQNHRLPALPRSTDRGFVYVLKSGEKYKIGFSRHNVQRQVRSNEGELVLLIRTGQRPAQLEYLINNRFASKRLPPQGTQPGGKREWFQLTDADIDWLRGLSSFLDHNI